MSNRNLIISDIDTFLQLDEEQGESLESITFKNIDLTYDFYEHRRVLWHIPSIHFTNCRLGEGVEFFTLLNSCYPEKLSIVNCGLTARDLSGVFCLLPQEVWFLDFSGNNLGAQKPSTLDILKGRRIYIRFLDLRNNNYTDDARRGIIEYQKRPLTLIREIKL